MNFLAKKAYMVFWIAAVFCLMIGLGGNFDALTLNVHDTYFVIATNALCFDLAFIYGLIGAVYLGIERSNYKLSNWMTITHLICSIDLIILIALVSFFDWFGNFNQLVILFLFIATLFGQLIFLVNIIKSFFRSEKRKTDNT